MASRSFTAPRVAGLTLALACAAWPGCGAAKPRAPGDGPIQMLADVTLIDLQCRELTVTFGPAFGSAAAQGLDVASVLPGQPLRPRLVTALRRMAETPREELCGTLATTYAAAMPGLLSRP